MGQKVNPIIFRVGFTRGWESNWYADKHQYGSYLVEDDQIRKFLMHALRKGGVSRITIERALNNVTVNIYSSKPGMIIGKKGDNIDKLRNVLGNKFGRIFQINIKEIRTPDLDAKLVGDMVAQQIERRFPYRRATKQAIEKTMQAGAKGIKIRVAGRLNGAEIARVEFFKEGNIPLHTLRADIDYAEVRAYTQYGTIGIKVWIYKGLKFGPEEQSAK